ncbi:MAG: TIM barrel protein [Sphaerochaeta sp.]|nr:TIM barrel protein [Spirochaetales bacterium]
MHYSVSLDTIFQSIPSLDQLKKLHGMGYRHVEWKGFPQQDTSSLVGLLKESSLACHAFGMPEGSLVDGTLHAQFVENLHQALEMAKQLGNRLIVCGVGNALESSHESQLEAMVVGLELCLPLLKKYDCELLIEPRNTRIDNKGYALSRSGDAAAVLKLIDDPHVRLLYNIYHQQISEGNILIRLEKYLPWIGHIRAGGVPGRAELDSGELSYRRIFAYLESLGYTGNIGLEYFPKRPPFEGLESCMMLRSLK